LKNRESESSNVSLAKTSKWSSQPSAEEGEIMAQKKFLVTGATGDTGGYTVEQLVERGHAVRALAHREDDRSKRLEKIGAEVLIGVRTRNGNLSTVRSSLLRLSIRRHVFPSP
jgi:nucleoside-diphosphate-sugar epimerase